MNEKALQNVRSSLVCFGISLVECADKRYVVNIEEEGVD